MKGFLLLMLFVSFSFSSSLSLFWVSAGARQEIIRVPADYSTIQEAINAAASGSIILVSSGVYRENLVIGKDLTLIGEDRLSTIIDGNRAGIVVYIKANRVVVNGFTVRNGTEGVYIDHSNGCVISNNIIASNWYSGIFLNRSSSNVIYDNLISMNGASPPSGGIVVGEGIVLSYSNDNVINDNRLIRNIACGISFYYSNDNLIVNNTIEASNSNIQLIDAQNNTIHHNNFLSSWSHVDIMGSSSSNIWDDGSVGNYWDDYTGLDDGSNGRIAGDGVGDTDLPHLGVDNYPLINPLGPIPVVWENREYPVMLVSNFTVSEFRFMQTEKKITFKVRGANATVGFCNITIPRNLLRGYPWKILLNITDITSEAIITENQTYTLIHFTCSNSGTFNVQIIGTWVIPEYPSTITLSLFIVFSTLIIVLIKTKSRKKSQPNPTF